MLLVLTWVQPAENLNNNNNISPLFLNNTHNTIYRPQSGYPASKKKLKRISMTGFELKTCHVEVGQVYLTTATRSAALRIEYATEATAKAVSFVDLFSSNTKATASSTDA